MSQNWRSTWSFAWTGEEPTSTAIKVAIRGVQSGTLLGVSRRAFMFGGIVWWLGRKQNTRFRIKYMMDHVIDHVTRGNCTCQTSFCGGRDELPLIRQQVFHEALD